MGDLTVNQNFLGNHLSLGNILDDGRNDLGPALVPVMSCPNKMTAGTLNQLIAYTGMLFGQLARRTKVLITI